MVYVLEKIRSERPELDVEDVSAAWNGAFVCVPRKNSRPFEYIAATRCGRALSQG